jgi:hypothetical protein
MPGTRVAPASSRATLRAIQIDVRCADCSDA